MVNVVDLIVGARPNLVKAAALVDAHRGRHDWQLRLVNTGQHYDDRLTTALLDQLGLRADVNLDVGPGSPNVQTARVLERLEAHFTRSRPRWVVVVGDVTSTFAATLTANRLGIPVAHVEAGLRSFDRGMPEEINRILTDSIAELLFVSEPSGLKNLGAEGIRNNRVHFVGNVMIDTLLRHRSRAEALKVSARLGVAAGEYVLVTLHRPGNVDDADGLATIVGCLNRLAAKRSVIFPVHPRTQKRLGDAGLLEKISARVLLTEPQPYLEFISLICNAAVVLTDSGGIQEETTALGVPCVTMRPSTERPATIQWGTNVLAGDNPATAVAAVERALTSPRPNGRLPEKWDGRAAERILHILDAHLSATRPVDDGSLIGQKS